MNRIDWDDAMNHVRESFRSAHPLNSCKVAQPRGKQMSKTLDEYLHEIYVRKLVGSIVVSCHDMAGIKSEQDARIAELTETLSLAHRLLVAETRSKAELTAEVAGYKKALEIIAQYDDGYAIPASDGPTRIDLARNALKEGVI